VKDFFLKLSFSILISQNIFAEKNNKVPTVDSISVKAFLISALENKEREAAGLRAKIAILARYPNFNEDLKEISIRPSELKDLLSGAPSINSAGLIFGPVLEDAKILGYQIAAIEPQHPYFILGLRRGDIIRSLNGSNPSQMDAMYGIWLDLKSKLSQGKFSKLTVEFDRGSMKKTLSIIPMN